MLKVMKVSYSQSLIKIPDFTGVLNLEKLYLEGCTRLREIHPSLLLHSKLVILNLTGCTSLATLPGKIFMKSIKKLVLSGCSKLKKFPKIVGNMECLSKLLLDGTAIGELPLSIELLSKLVSLDLNNCKNFKNLPVTISSLKCLRSLVLSGCSKLKKFPEIVESMEDLSELFLDGTSITEVPSSIELLTGLNVLNLNDCKNLVRIPDSINGLKSLQTLNLSGCFKLENVPETLGQVESLEELHISGTAIRQPPSGIFHMKNLKALYFRGCKGSPSSTSWSRHFPFNLIKRSLDPVAFSFPPSLSGLYSLTKLDLSDCDLGEGFIPNDIGNLRSLKVLCLSNNSFVSLPASISHLSKLERLNLNGCKELQSLPPLPARMRIASVNGCTSLETLSDPLELNKLKDFEIQCMDCVKLQGNNDLALSLLKEHMEQYEDMTDYHKYCSIVVPGSKIPEWFEHRNNEGSSIRISRSSKTYKNSKLVGYAMCCVFQVHKHSPPYLEWFSHLHKLDCKIKCDGGDTWISTPMFRKQFGQAVSEHFWLHYEPNVHLFGMNNGVLSFESSSGLEVKRCGFHPVYEIQVEKFNKTTPVWNLNDFNHDSSGSKTLFERSLIDEYDRAETSESGSRDDEKVSQIISFSLNDEEHVQRFIIGFRDGNLTKTRINLDDPDWV